MGNFLGLQFTHVDWKGLLFYDFIFPLFIFVTGVSIVLSLPGLVEREGKAKAHWRVVRRSLLLYVLGVIAYGGISHSWGWLLGLAGICPGPRHRRSFFWPRRQSRELD